MKNGVVIFLGVFFTLAFSWTGLVLIPQKQFGGLGIAETEAGEFPKVTSGLALRGEQVYLDLGCVYCHTQQVRRPGYGADFERGWGDRQSVARDYIGDRRMVLGTMRTGPDLTNIGDRTQKEWHYRHLYNSRLVHENSTMPPYRFLFEKRKIVGEPSPRALTDLGDDEPPEGYEIVPTPRAEALIAYLMSRTLDYDLEESTRQ